ncbi:EFR1 family ferrodoxin [Macellibacteroides fermentans]|uniref:EFR1 family ferrodoxin n=1 Tax=Macellibacteroides fermentans TaxID=879969 RepID=UPI00406C6142
MATELFYISGTGNSLHTAKELQKKLTDVRLIPLAAVKNEEKLKTEGDIVGFVFPVHFMTAPSIVFRILERMDMNSAEYVFAVATRYGTPCNVMYKQFDQILKKKGKSLNSYITITMANNDPKFKFWKPASKQALDVFEALLQEKLDLLCTCIMKKEDYHETDREATFKVNPAAERLGVLAATLTGDGKEAFYSDSNCIGCGLCEKVCPSTKVRIVDGKPQWLKNEDCYSCYACLNFCPQHAIQIGSSKIMKFYTEVNGRYHHESISADEIASQKMTGD